MIPIYFSAIFWNFRRIFTQGMWGQILVGLAYLVILTLLFMVVFFLGYTSFRFLSSFSQVSKPVIEHILLSALAFTTILSVVSFTISLMLRLFEKKLAVYFLAGVPKMRLFQTIFLENFFVGGWPFLILALPLLLAFLASQGALAGSYLLLFILFGLLVIFTESLGAILAILLRYFLGGISQKMIYLLSFLLLLVLGVVFKNLFLPSGLWEVSSRPTLTEVFAGLSSLPVANQNLPPALFLQALSGSFLAFLIFIFFVGLVYFLSLAVADKFYLTSWQKAREGVFLAKPRQTTDGAKSAVRFHGLFWGLFRKEYLTFDRTPSLLLYFSFVIFLALIYFFLLSQNPRSPEILPNLFPKVVTLTMMIIGYLTIMISLRFAFPSLLSEFRHFWLLSRLPKARSQLILVKWVAHTLLPVLTAWFLAVLAFFLLRFNLEILPFFIGTTLACAIVISTINLFVGTWWVKALPAGEIDQTTTALPGVLTTLGSIFSVFILSAIFYQFAAGALSGEIDPRSGGQYLFLPAIILVGSLLAWFLAFNLARKKFSRVDIS